MCLVSVIIPYYNQEGTILRALNSVKNQTFKNLEIILINDGSTDNGEKVVNNFINENKEIYVKNITQKNSGPSKARNEGIKITKGKYIAFLDSDDCWVESKLEKQISYMVKYDADLLGCNVNIIFNNINKKHYFTRKKNEKVNFKKMMYKHKYTPSGVVVKKKVIINQGGFPEWQRNTEDDYIFTKIARKYNAYVINDFLVNQYKPSFGYGGLSADLNTTERCELNNFKLFYKDNKIYSNKIPIYIYISAVIFSIIKFFRRKVMIYLQNLLKINRLIMDD